MDTVPEVPNSEVHAIAHVSRRLRTRFPDIRAEAIDRMVTDALHEFDGRPIRDFVPILVERSVLDLIRGSAATDQVATHVATGT